MHISEGILSPPVLGAGWAITAGLLVVSLRRINELNLSRMAVFACAFFLASLVRVPVGAASAHFALLGLMGLVLGWGAFPAILLSLTLQALLFQFGGFLSLGVNAAVMGGSALLVWLALGRVAVSGGMAGTMAAFLVGSLSIALGTALVYVALVCSNAALSGTATMLAVASLPLAVLEGVVTAFAVGFLHKVAPDMLEGGHRVSA